MPSNQPVAMGTKLRNVASAIGALFRPTMQQKTLSPVSDRGWHTIFDWKPGAWQQDAVPISTDRVLAHWAVFACVSLIAEDLGKLRLRLVEQDADGIWKEVRSAAFGPVLRKPNRYQTRQQFISSWALSKLIWGATFVLKQRDNRGVVTALHVLDPLRVEPLIAPSGAVFYRLGKDDLATLPRESDVAPAYEVIHDRGVCPFHPLLGVSPLYACGLAAQQGLAIQKNSSTFFRNQSLPGGLLIAPAEISDSTAERLRQHWQQKFGGDNAGKVAVLGDGLKYQAMNVNPVDAQLVEQLGLTAKMVCSAFRVPPFKIGLETLPAGQKVSDMNQIYYSDALQSYLESIEVLLDEGLGLTETGRALGTEFDLDDLLKMDQATLMATLKQGDGIMTPDEQRKRLNLPPVAGGNTVYKQQQDHSLSALEKRDSLPNPFAPDGGVPATSPAPGEIEAEMQRRLDSDRLRMAAERETAELIGRVRAALGT